MLDDLQGIDARAVVHPGAEIGEGSAVGPFAVIGSRVRLAGRVKVGAHAVIDGDTEVGEETHVYPFCTIGFPPQDLKFRGEDTRTRIGARNIFREYGTVNRGTAGGVGLTSIGDENFFMAYSHVAHDCHVANRTVFANAATLAGHVDVADDATVGAFSAVHQFCRVGPHAYIGGFSVVTRDAMPYCLTVGNRAGCHGINRIGLERKGFSPQTIRALKRAHRTIFRSGRLREEALAVAEEEGGDVPEVRLLVEFIRSSRRGVAA